MQGQLKKNILSTSPRQLRIGGEPPIRPGSKEALFSSRRISPTALKILKMSPAQATSPSSASDISARPRGSPENDDCAFQGRKQTVASAALTPRVEASFGSPANQSCPPAGEKKHSTSQVSGPKQANGATFRSPGRSLANSNSSPKSGVGSDKKWNPVVVLWKLPELGRTVSVMSLSRTGSPGSSLRGNVDTAFSPAASQMSGGGGPAAAGCDAQAGGKADFSRSKADYFAETCGSDTSENRDAFSIPNSVEGLVFASLEIAANDRIDEDELGNALEVCARMAQIHPESNKTPIRSHRRQDGSKVRPWYQAAFDGVFPETADSASNGDGVGRTVRSSVDVSRDLSTQDQSCVAAVGLPQGDWRRTRGKAGQRKRGRPRKDSTPTTVHGTGKLKS